MSAGGKRLNAGRKVSEPTEVLYIRVPKGCIIEARLSVYKIIEAHKAKSFPK